MFRPVSFSNLFRLECGQNFKFPVLEHGFKSVYQIVILILMWIMQEGTNIRSALASNDVIEVFMIMFHNFFSKKLFYQ